MSHQPSDDRASSSPEQPSAESEQPSAESGQPPAESGPPPAESDPPSGEEDGARRALRAKYLDFCSARLSEVFLSLSDERIYDLMEEAARDSGLNPADLGFGRMVRLATEKLWHSVPLPDFEAWSREYREDPERYDPYLLGFTEEHRPEAPGDEGGGRDDGAGSSEP